MEAKILVDGQWLDLLIRDYESGVSVKVDNKWYNIQTVESLKNNVPNGTYVSTIEAKVKVGNQMVQLALAKDFTESTQPNSEIIYDTLNGFTNESRIINIQDYITLKHLEKQSSEIIYDKLTGFDSEIRVVNKDNYVMLKNFEIIRDRIKFRESFDELDISDKIVKHNGKDSLTLESKLGNNSIIDFYGDDDFDKDNMIVKHKNKKSLTLKDIK